MKITLRLNNHVLANKLGMVLVAETGFKISANCQLPTANCLLPTAYCLLPTAYCLLPTAY